VLVAHATVLANAQALAGRLQSLCANLGLLPRLQALGCALMGSGHGAVARDVFFDLFV
jgi:hypothetical protein